MVRRVGKQKPLTVKMNNGGKPSVVIRVNKKSVQKPVGQLVLETFKGKNLYKHTNFKYLDGDVMNNNISNLSWCRYEYEGSKPILQIDLEGNVIRKWDSFFDARDIGGFNITSIKHCCEGKLVSHGGYYWNYNIPNLKKIHRHKKFLIMKTVDEKIEFDDLESAYEYCKENTHLIASFESFKTSVSTVKGTRNKYLGFLWRNGKRNF